MAQTTAYPHLVVDADGTARLERVPRVRVAQLAMDHLAHGWSAEDVCRQYPYLTPAEFHAAFGYYFDHQDDMDDQIRREWEQARRDATAAASPRVVARLWPRKAS